MIVTHKINMNMDRAGVMPRVDVVQGDANTREIQFSLFSGGQAWEVPTDAQVLVRYKKANGAGGTYDTMSDGAAAAVVSGNTVTVTLAPQALSADGSVSLAVTLVKGEAELSTFAVQLNVMKNPTAATDDDGNYVSVSGLLPALDSAEVGQYLEVAAVDENGKITKLTAVDAPSGGVSDEQIASAVEAYLEENPIEIPDSSQNVDQSNSVFKGKTASFYGDSLTEANYHYTKGYHKWVNDILGLASYNNYGKSGYKVSDVYNKVNSVTDTADIIFVMCGVNDQNFSVPLGAMGDDTTGTIYGALNLLCALLKQKYPTKLVVFITPHYQTKYPHSSGVTSYEVSKAIREVCEKYVIPVYDNFVLSGIYNTNLSTFTTDNCHWNDTAHEMVGKNLARFMANTFQYIHGNTSGEDTHTHSYMESVTTAATCTTAGVKTFTCECGDTYTESIPATGHSWNDGIVTVEPTEDTEGVRTYTCTVCGETRTENIPTLDHEHSYVSTVIAPTCTEQGYTEHVCACGDSYKDTYVAATDHSYISEVITEPTCTTEGVRTYTCSVCGDTYTETIAATGHNYVDGACSVCGAADPDAKIVEIINDSADSVTVNEGVLSFSGLNQTFCGVLFTDAKRVEIDVAENVAQMNNFFSVGAGGYGWFAVRDGSVYHAFGCFGTNVETYDFDATLANATKTTAPSYTYNTTDSLSIELVDGVATFRQGEAVIATTTGDAVAYIVSSSKANTIYGVDIGY